MADYTSPTVVQQTLPAADMTPLERLVLCHVFDAEPDGAGLYFFAEVAPSDTFELTVEELRAAFAESAKTPSQLQNRMAECLAKVEDGDTDIEVDLSATSWEFISRTSSSGRLRLIT